MNLANIPLAAKVYIGAMGGVALLGGGVALGAHLGSSAAQAASSSAIVAPTASAPPTAAPAAGNTGAQAVHRAALAAEAQVLGVSTKQLNADFKAGTTVQQLATARGLSQAQFQAQFATALKNQLDQEVTAGTVTQTQEQQAVKRLTAAIPNWSQVGAAARKSPSPTPTP